MSYDVANIPLSDILCDEEFNCRGKILPIDVADMVQELTLNGLMYPITIQPHVSPGKKYRIVAGHRRFTAFKLMGRTEIPCYIREGLNELAARTMNLTENLKRQDLNLLQEARAIRPFVDAGWAEETIASQLSTSRGWVQVRKMLLQLPEDIQMEVAAGVINQDQVRKLFTIKEDKNLMYEMVRIIKDRRAAGNKIEFAKPSKPHRKEARNPTEIFLLQTTIRDAIGDSLITQIMGWCAGVVSDYEIHKAIKQTAKAIGRSYDIPKNLVEQL